MPASPVPERTDRFLAAFPGDLGHLLAIGTVGGPHLLRAARAALSLLKGNLGQDAPAVLSLARDLLCLAWAEVPDNGDLAAEALDLGRRSGGLLPPLSRGLQAALEAAAACRTPRDLGDYGDIWEQGDQAATAELVCDRLAAGGAAEARFWLGRLFWHGGLAGQWEAVAAALRDHAPDPDEAGMLLLRGQAALHGGDPAEALSLLERAAEGLGEPWLLSRLAEAHAATGATDKAARLYAGAVAAKPWHVHALLRLGTLALGGIGPGRLDGPCVVNLYTWNKADDLAATLDSLRASDLDAAADKVLVRVLDNGSDDGTAAVLERASRAFGPGRLDVVRLPVNVGAPAARNWLMRKALHPCDGEEGFSWVAYLDDDMFLPPDWLARLAGAAGARPDAGVWGCRVMDAKAPTIVQHADEMLVPPAGGETAFQLACLPGSGHEYGRFGYDRHAATVMGCCHLFRAADLKACGPFDLNLSPSQYDDVDHDLRLLDMGRPPFCLGTLGVTHARGVGPLSPPTAVARALSEANKTKLAALHAGRMERLLAAQRDVLMADLAGLRASLEREGALGRARR